MATKGELLFRDHTPGGVTLLSSYLTAPGKVFFVDDSGTDAAGHGSSPDKPVATLDYAIGLCTSDRGDTIVVMPGHAETINSVTVDKSDLTIVGCGQGANRPRLTFNAGSDEINVTADDVTIRNLWLYSSVAGLTNFFDLDAQNFTAEDLVIEVASGTAGADCVFSIATTKDWFTFRNIYAIQDTDPDGTDQGAGTGFIYCVDTENILVENCTVLGNYETAIIHNKTTACANLIIRDCVFRQDLSTGLLIELVAGATGNAIRLIGNSPNADDATAAKVIGTYGTAFWFDHNCSFSNDSGGGGQLGIPSEAACS